MSRDLGRDIPDLEKLCARRLCGLIFRSLIVSAKSFFLHRCLSASLHAPSMTPIHGCLLVDTSDISDCFSGSEPREGD